MRELSEDATARNADGICVVCHVGPGEDHDQSAHDLYWAAEGATWK